MDVWHCPKCKASIPSKYIECKFCGTSIFTTASEVSDLKRTVQEKQSGSRKERVLMWKV